jgi:aspartate/glutamate racemase
MKAAANLLGTTKRIARLSAEDLSRDSAEYGTVNPFSEATEYIQVFDEDVLTQYMPPHTMMTNAGAHTWAVEFRPSDIINALRMEAPQVLVGRITTETSVPKRIPVFGIITGNGPESGIALWRNVNEEIHAHLTLENRMRGDLSYPKVVVQSIPEMGLSMELVQREDDVWEVIRNAIEQMAACGVTHLTLACNTTQYFSDRIRNFCDPAIKFVSMVDVTSEYIRQENLDDITIIGIPIVASLGEYSAYRALKALGVRAVEEHARPYMEEMAYLVKQLDAISPDTKSLNRLQHVMRSGVQTSRVLIALTEVSVLLERFPRLRKKIGGKAVIDPLRLCGKALADIYLRALPQEEVQEFPLSVIS